MLFSERLKLAEEIEIKLNRDKIKKDALGVITVLQTMGLLKDDNDYKDLKMKRENPEVYDAWRKSKGFN